MATHASDPLGRSAQVHSLVPRMAAAEAAAAAVAATWPSAAALSALVHLPFSGVGMSQRVSVTKKKLTNIVVITETKSGNGNATNVGDKQKGKPNEELPCKWQGDSSFST